MVRIVEADWDDLEEVLALFVDLEGEACLVVLAEGVEAAPSFRLSSTRRLAAATASLLDLGVALEMSGVVSDVFLLAEAGKAVSPRQHYCTSGFKYVPVFWRHFYSRSDVIIVILMKF